MCDSGAGPSPAEQLLTVSQRVESGAVVVRVEGEIDTMTVPRLRAALDDAFRSAVAKRVVVDLLAVRFIDSAGLDALVRAAEQAEQRREPLRVVVDSHRPVLRPIQLTGLDAVLTLSHSVEEALAM